MIRKIVFLLIALTGAWGSLLAQCENDSPDWKWCPDDPSGWSTYSEDWTAFVSGMSISEVAVPLPNPFAPSAVAQDTDFDKIKEAQDFYPKDGWELVIKSFGCATNPHPNQPYFILYNRYRSLFRIYQNTSMLGGLDNPQSAVIEMGWANEVNRTNLFGLASENVLSHYSYENNFAATPYNHVNVNDKISKAGWYYTDFIVNFDPDTDDGLTYKLLIDSKNVVQSSLLLDGEFEFTTKTIKGNPSESPGSNPGETQLNWNSIVSTLEGLPDKDKFTKTLDDIESGLGNASTGITDLFGTKSKFIKGTSQWLANMQAKVSSEEVSKVFDFVGGVSGALKSAAPAVKFFAETFGLLTGTSSSNQVELLPTHSEGTINLTGSITTKFNMNEIAIDLPGGKHSLNSPAPFYDCPLGVVILEKEPKLRYKTIKGVKTGQLTIQTETFTSPEPDFEVEIYPKTTDYKTIKVSEDLEIAVNDAAGMELVNAHASIIWDQPIAHGSKTTQNFTYVPGGHIQESTTYSNYSTKPIREYLEKGYYLLKEIKSLGPAAPYGIDYGLMEYSTPLVNVESFKNTSISVPESANNFRIKVVAEFIPIDPLYNEKPVVHVITFSLDNRDFWKEDEIISLQGNQQADYSYLQSLFYPHTVEQEFDRDLDTTYRDTISYGFELIENDVIIAREDAITFLGDEKLNAKRTVVLEPGFMATPMGNNHFAAQITPIFMGENLVFGENGAQFNHYFTECYIARESGRDTSRGKQGSFGNEWTEATDRNNVLLYPNPADASVTAKLTLADDAELSVFITDVSGKIVIHPISGQHFQSGSHYIPLETSLLNSGIYFLVIDQGGRRISEKLIISH